VQEGSSHPGVAAGRFKSSRSWFKRVEVIQDRVKVGASWYKSCGGRCMSSMNCCKLSRSGFKKVQVNQEWVQVI
jgi:hypothetical protein